MSCEINTTCYCFSVMYTHIHTRVRLPVHYIAYVEDGHHVQVMWSRCSTSAGLLPSQYWVCIVSKVVEVHCYTLLVHCMAELMLVNLSIALCFLCWVNCIVMPAEEAFWFLAPCCATISSLTFRRKWIQIEIVRCMTVCLPSAHCSFFCPHTNFTTQLYYHTNM